jgi:hypothetical protein
VVAAEALAALDVDHLLVHLQVRDIIGVISYTRHGCISFREWLALIRNRYISFIKCLVIIQHN